jgi:phenylpropionate dioxygenase-like ring-hydroxylating dioxygenase large terminal subunit
MSKPAAHDMTRTTDRVALDQWYAIATLDEFDHRPMRTRLLGQDIIYRQGPDGPKVREIGADGRCGAPLPIHKRYGCLWTTLGAPAGEIFDLPESDESDRRIVICGWMTMRTSGLRLVENFLDMAHFPYIHTDVLGAEPHTEVPHYASEIRRDIDEVWATNCQFYQPQIVVNGPGGMVQLTYRVPSPFVVMLYRVCPSAPDRLDVIAMFIQPMEECLCRAVPVMYLVDDKAPFVDLLKFEQTIFLQDRIIVENQRPVLLPLEPRSETPTRADLSSVTYRRWLKEKGLRYGTAEGGTTS